MTQAPEKTFIRAVISLGSNIPDRAAHLQNAVDRFRNDKNSKMVKISGVYESPPEGEDFTGDFLNAILVLDTSLSPEGLLELCHKVEAVCGRDRIEEKRLNTRNRTIDCDVIFFGDDDINSEGLSIPHAEWSFRAFVLMPLNDVKSTLTEHQKRLVDNFTKMLDFEITSCHRTETVLH